MLLLYNPPSSANRKPVLPMSLLSLGAVLDGRHPYRIIDGNLESDPLAALDAAIREHDADILAVTVMPGPQLHGAVPTCRALKERFSELTIVWGGYFPTQHWQACIDAPYVDYVVRGHNERGFLQLVDVLRGRDEAPLHAIEGLAYSDPLGSHTTGVAAVPHPEQLPDFPYDRVPMHRYIRSTFLGRRTVPHHSSYGCPFFCNFCAVVNLVDGKWLAQSAERVANVVHGLVRRWGVDAVEFYDNNFFVSEARVEEFSERIRDLGIRYWGEARVDTLLKFRDSTWRAMSDAGLKMVFLGAETGSDETLANMNKGGTLTADKTLELVERMKSYGVIPELSFVLGNPPDPEGDTRQTIAFIRRVKRINPAAEIILYMYTPVPLSGTLFDEARATGFAFPETLDGWVSDEWQEFAQRRSSNMPWLSDPLRREVAEFQSVLNAYYPTHTDPGLGRMRRALLRSMSAWRYHLGYYRRPLELAALRRFVSYQRPETAGF